ncbi:hypothetical protein [Quadrisphaera sp. KR29]|uniref:hypothetical protein n=1 Tax=Quadrisphaera sp. KR29 TaxID=3461391 RepID=UPI004043AB8C
MSTLHLALALGGPRPGPSTSWSHLVREAEAGLLDLVTLEGAGAGADELGDVALATRLAAGTRSIGLLPTVHAGRSEPSAIARAVEALDAASGGRAGVHLRVPVPADEHGWVQAVRRHSSSGPGAVVALPGRPGRGPRALPAGAADLAFVAPRTTVDAQQLVAAARAAGAPPLLLGDLVVVVDESAERARARWERSAGELPGTAPEGTRVFCGTPAQLADLAQGWRAAGLAGLRLHPADPAVDVLAATRALVPELQRRGAFRRAYSGAGLRQRLGERAPAHPAPAHLVPGARPSDHCAAA